MTMHLPTCALDSTLLDAHTIVAAIKDTLSPDAKLYMLVDAAIDDAIYPALEASERLYSCLYDANSIPDVVRAVAPYIIRVEPLDTFVQWCLEVGMTKHACVVFAAEGLAMPDLRFHFKKFSKVCSPKGKPLLFRYYDPRVMYTFLNHASVEESTAFFKAISAFWVPKVVGNALAVTQFRADGTQADATHKWVASAERV